LRWFKSRRNYLEAYYTLVDFLFNKKTGDEDRYEVFPVRSGIKGEITLWGHLRIRPNIIITSASKKWIGEEEYFIKEEERIGDVTIEFLSGEGFVAGLRGLFFQKDEAVDTYNLYMASYKFNSKTLILRPYIVIPIKEKITLIPGGYYVNRREETILPNEYITCDYLREDIAATIEANWRMAEYLGLRFGWFGGWISSDRKCNEYSDREQSFDNTQNKLNLITEIYFKKTSRLLINFTLDAEQFHHHVWDGGNVMFIALF